MKPASPLLAQAQPQLKPPSPLQVRNGRFWHVFRAQRCRRFQRPRVGASSGDGGFTLVCISGSSGVVGFNVATSQLPVREKVRPARPGADASAKKFAQRTKNGPQSAFYGVPGEFFRENTAGGVAPGEVFRGTAAEQTVLGEFCRTTTHARLLLGCLRLGPNRKATCWERHRRMGMKKHSRRSAW